MRPHDCDDRSQAGPTDRSTREMRLQQFGQQLTDSKLRHAGRVGRHYVALSKSARLLRGVEKRVSVTVVHALSGVDRDSVGLSIGLRLARSCVVSNGADGRQQGQHEIDCAAER